MTFFIWVLLMVLFFMVVDMEILDLGVAEMYFFWAVVDGDGFGIWLFPMLMEIVFTLLLGALRVCLPWLLPLAPLGLAVM